MQRRWPCLHLGELPFSPLPLPSELEETGWAESASSHGSDEDLVLHPHVGIPGPTFDASVLATPKAQARFHRNLAAVTAVLAGMRISGVARAHGMAVSTLARLVWRTQELGQIACVPNATYHRNRLIHPELQQLIRKLYTQPLRPTITAIYEDVQLKHLAEELSQREGKPISAPSYHQVWDARSGDRSRDRGRRCSLRPQASSTGADVLHVICALHRFACLDLKGATNIPWICWS